MLQIISGLQNLDRDNVAAVVTAADKVSLCVCVCSLLFSHFLHYKYTFFMISSSLLQIQKVYFSLCLVIGRGNSCGYCL